MQEKIRKFSFYFMSALVKVVIIVIIGFILFNLGRSIWKNYLVVQNIDAVKKEISDAENANKNLKNLIIYYQTDTYKELEVRKTMGYKKPGENVLIIPELNSKDENRNSSTNLDNSPKEENQTANFIKWYHYVIN